jgi:hypothetical protein
MWGPTGADGHGGLGRGNQRDPSIMGQRGAGAARPREGGPSRSAAGGAPIRVATRAPAQSGRLRHPSDPSPARGPPGRFPAQSTATRHAAGAPLSATVRPAGTHSLPSQTLAGRPACRAGPASTPTLESARAPEGRWRRLVRVRATDDSDGRLGPRPGTPSRCPAGLSGEAADTVGPGRPGSPDRAGRACRPTGRGRLCRSPRARRRAALRLPPRRCRPRCRQACTSEGCSATLSPLAMYRDPVPSRQS